MIPQTAVAVVVFTLLILPGVVFELLRQTRRPSFDQTPLEEVARIILASVGALGAGVAILGAVGFVAPRLVIDIPDLAAQGSATYWSTHPRQVLANVIGLLVISIALVLLAHRSLNQSEKGWVNRGVQRVSQWLGHRPGSAVERFSVWRTLLREHQPKGADTKVTVVKTDGTLVTGLLAGYDTSGSPSERDLALQPPIEVLRPGWSSPTSLGDGWKRMIISGRDIAEILVTWPPSAERGDGATASDSSSDLTGST